MRRDEEKVSDNATSKRRQTGSFPSSFRWIKATSGLFCTPSAPLEFHTEHPLGQMYPGTLQTQHATENKSSRTKIRHNEPYFECYTLIANVGII